LLVSMGISATVLYGLVDRSPWEGDVLFPIVIIAAMVGGVAAAIRAPQFWPARIALCLVFLYVVAPPIARILTPTAFPSYADQISDGMTVEEVKDILGPPESTERLTKLVKVDIGAPLLDADGNPLGSEYTTTVDGDLLLQFKKRRTNIVVRFNESSEVVHCYETFDLP